MCRRLSVLLRVRADLDDEGEGGLVVVTEDCLGECLGE